MKPKMPSITIRQLEDGVKDFLRMKSAKNQKNNKNCQFLLFELNASKNYSI